MSTIKTLIDRAVDAAPSVTDAIASLGRLRPGMELTADPDTRLTVASSETTEDSGTAQPAAKLQPTAPVSMVGDADGVTAAWEDVVKAKSRTATVKASPKPAVQPKKASEANKAQPTTAQKSATAARTASRPKRVKSSPTLARHFGSPITASFTVDPALAAAPEGAADSGTKAPAAEPPATASARKAEAGIDPSRIPAFGRRKTDKIAQKAMTSAMLRKEEPGVDESKADRAMRLDEAATFTKSNRERVLEAKSHIQPLVMDTLDVSEALRTPRAELAAHIAEVVSELQGRAEVQLNLFEQRDLVTQLINDMVGLGPLEPILGDESVSEIMVNGPRKVYVEREGKISLTNYRFESDSHALNICQRIVAQVGRRVDESSPICDARLKDGSRVNVVVPPLALDGPTITIRRFTKEKLTIDKLVDLDAMTPQVADLLRVIGACRLNVLISGGTGSGKTTLLNCLTGYIDAGERVITCEDAAELQLQQPHVVRLETRPPNLEGKGEITMRDLVRNCLRMRPERIIVGEVRGPEAFDLLQAMNTGHDGSMGTVHANNPREAVSRLENMIAMGGFNMPTESVRDQIGAALDVIIQTERLRDGSRKITRITEVVGMEEDVITMQDLVTYEIRGETPEGRIIGEHHIATIRPAFWDRAREFGLEADLFGAMDLGEGVIRMRA